MHSRVILLIKRFRKLVFISSGFSRQWNEERGLKLCLPPYTVCV